MACGNQIFLDLLDIFHEPFPLRFYFALLQAEENVQVGRQAKYDQVDISEQSLMAMRDNEGCAYFRLDSDKSIRE
jgi:hypothetical protein